MRNWCRLATLSTFLIFSPVTSGLAGDTKPHRLVIQVDQNDPAVMNLALNNATNVITHRQEVAKRLTHGAHGDAAVIETEHGALSLAVVRRDLRGHHIGRLRAAG